jgi:hypothetical protein
MMAIPSALLAISWHFMKSIDDNRPFSFGFSEERRRGGRTVAEFVGESGDGLSCRALYAVFREANNRP